MKYQTLKTIASVAAVMLMTAVQLPAQPSATPMAPLTANQITLSASLSPEIKPMPVLGAMQRVADWKLAHPLATSDRSATSWIKRSWVTLGANESGNEC